jgi:short-subunit dehydrogenase/SAM-dependent methyltransferase
VVLVGCSTGIGRALALELARRGVTLCLFARRLPLLQELSTEIVAQGGEAIHYAGDTTDAEIVAQAFEYFSAQGAVDGLLYLAGISHVTQPREISGVEAREVLEVNFHGFLSWMELLLPLLIARGEGFVGACSALCAYRGIPTGEAYAASKAALNAYLESLALDLPPYGVEVFQLMPGFVESPMSALNNFTQPFLIPAPEAAQMITQGLLAGRFRIEFGVGMSRLMRVLRWLPDRVYARIFADFSRRRHDTEALLLELPPFLCPRLAEPLEFDRYGVFRHPNSESWVRFRRDSLEILESSDRCLDEAHEKITTVYRLYSLTYPVTAFLSMTFVWKGRLGPLVDFYAQALREAVGTDQPLLDVATGDASLLALALRKVPTPPAIFSVDLSLDMVQKAARRLRKNRRKLFYVHDIASLNMPDGSFRNIACYGGFHVFPAPEEAMARIAALLHPEGQLTGSILTRPSRPWGAWLSDRFIEWGGLSNSMNEAQVEEIFLRVGLEIVEKVWNGHMLLFRARRCLGSLAEKS